jgi:hypothetical protein
VYTHWPTRLDLIQSAIEQVCDLPHHPPATGNLRDDLRVSLLDFATDLTDGHLDRLLGGVIERAQSDEVIIRLRTRLYEAGTSALRSVLAAHVKPADVEPSLALLTGAVLVRASFEGAPVTTAFVDDVIERTLSATRAGH